MSGALRVDQVLPQQPHGRVYVTQAWKRGGIGEPHELAVWTTAARIRQFAIEAFTTTFAGLPSFTWAEDGHAAECWDDAGNRLRVMQVNDR